MWVLWWTNWHWGRFLRVLRFPVPILIPPTTPQSSSGAGTIGQLVADVPSGLSLTPPQETKKKSKTIIVQPVWYFFVHYAALRADFTTATVLACVYMRV
jgi:hypothetical protein